MIDEFWRQWQTLATLGSTAWTPGTSGARSAGSAPGFRPFADSAERFASAVREFVVKSQGAEPAFSAADGFSNFLREHFAAFFKPPWPFSNTPTHGPAIADAPALGLGREEVLRAQRALAAWNRLTESQARLYRLWSDTLREAATVFTSRLQRESVEPLNAEAIERLYDLWIDCAEEAYAHTAHGEVFTDALSECVNAGSDWRRETAASIEHFAKLLDLPTRSEINALTRRLREVEAQLSSARQQPRRPPTPAPSTSSPRAARPGRSTKSDRSTKAKRSAKAARSAKPRVARSKRTP